MTFSVKNEQIKNYKLQYVASLIKPPVPYSWEESHTQYTLGEFGKVFIPWLG